MYVDRGRDGFLATPCERADDVLVFLDRSMPGLQRCQLSCNINIGHRPQALDLPQNELVMGKPKDLQVKPSIESNHISPIYAVRQHRHLPI